jgi:hypothetical protein
MACLPKPDVEGRVEGENVIINKRDAEVLKEWIARYQACQESNVARLLGHVEKLENRLKAVGGLS